MPIYGGPLYRNYHRQVGLAQGLSTGNILMVNNGETVEITNGVATIGGKVTSGTHLIDQNGERVPALVLNDRFNLEENGFIVVSVTIDRVTGRILSSPDIITRGSFSIRDNAELMDDLRQQVRTVVRTHKITRQTIDLVKYQLQAAVNSRLQKGRGDAPLVIPVVNIVGSQSVRKPSAHQAPFVR